MPIKRAFLVAVQATFYQFASTPPNKTPQKARFDSDHPMYIRVAPLIMKIQQPVLWICTAAELVLLFAAQDMLPLPPWSGQLIRQTICPASQSPNLHVSYLSLLGLAFVMFGSLLRLTCFRRLGNLFTFDLTIFPTHNLVKSGPYAYVRHPAYTGTLSMCLGIALINLTTGSWVDECGILGRGTVSAVLRVLGVAVWYVWWIAVGFTRCRSEDAELKKKFGGEWDQYSKEVRAWFVPGLL
ncbi:hypothetical protein PHLGIDRAFT_13625 [Phlebiopsis gigantea 11061_1 CR5-6]|uniref:Protein-S-isoprenylcysteine O-methyltransferase n=1 Tax=Phlebiopsis gigantea (strain 11061_1 CR5-6) TaxID=745531 RepID=A0A0C3NP41_PHLG1|nr:hypothetical protein PHLGIDRAFT_13625 [Phlebiopsis gigantea 11061_1 CR5-6]